MSLMQHSGVGDSKVGRNVMSTARNLISGLWSKFVLLSVTLPLLSGSAFAQIPAPDSSSSANPFSPKMSLGEKEKRQLTPEEQERQRQLDAAYKAATKKIPDQKTADPWGGVRPTPTRSMSRPNSELTLTTRRFTPPWSIRTAKMLTKDEARRIAANAAHCDKEAEVL